MRRLERKFATSGTAGYSDGDVMRGEVLDETCDAWLELNVWPVGVLGCVALCQVVVDREWDVGEEGE